MSDPYWPWWAAITFWVSGAFCAWLFAIVKRPDRVECPDCGHSIRTRDFLAHWKACLS